LKIAAQKDGKGGTVPKFLTEDYLKRYQDVIDAAQKLEMQVILYDDNDFPSDDVIETDLFLRGKLNLENWNCSFEAGTVSVGTIFKLIGILLKVR
jgi:hypothetical protein